MIDAVGIAVSGLTAQTKRVDASASNIANMRSRGALPDSSGTVAAGRPEAYRPVGVQQTALSASGDPAGTNAVYVPITPAWVPEYGADESFADANGIVAAPNVDPAQETVNQISASRSYAANTATIKTADEMLKSVLDMKA